MVNGKVSAIPQEQPLRELAWEDIDEPGAYVEVATGTLYRVHPEAVRRCAPPRLETGGAVQPRFVRLSKDPSIFPLGARMVCARHNIRPNF